MLWPTALQGPPASPSRVDVGVDAVFAGKRLRLPMTWFTAANLRSPEVPDTHVDVQLLDGTGYDSPHNTARRRRLAGIA